MVTVTFNQSFQVFEVPRIKVPIVIIFTLSFTPCIKRLVHDHKTHLITKIKQLRVRRIVACTDCIGTHLFQFHKLTFCCLRIECTSQRSEVVMITHTFYLDPFAVQIETVAGCKFDLPDPERLKISVDNIIVLNNRNLNPVPV